VDPRGTPVSDRARDARWHFLRAASRRVRSAQTAHPPSMSSTTMTIEGDGAAELREKLARPLSVAYCSVRRGVHATRSKSGTDFAGADTRSTSTAMAERRRGLVRVSQIAGWATQLVARRPVERCLARAPRPTKSALPRSHRHLVSLRPMCLLGTQPQIRQSAWLQPSRGAVPLGGGVRGTVRG